MIAHFYNFSKRVNSTKTPTGQGTVFNIVMKSQTSLDSPTVTVNVPLSESKYTYVYIEELNRYYHVVDITSVNANVTAYHLQVDVLATYRTDIRATRTFVTRSASNYNKKLYDNLWNHDGTVYKRSKPITDSGITGTGCFILQTVSNSASNVFGATTYYAVSGSNLSSLIENVFKLTNYSEATEEMKTYFNPFQYIVSCRWFPFTYDSFSETEEFIKAGWFTFGIAGVGISAKPLSTVYKSTSFTTVLAPSDYVSDQLDFTNRSSDWTNISMYYPGIGFFEIDPKYYGNSVTFNANYDIGTGTVVLTGTSNTAVIFSASGTGGIDIQLSQLYQDTITTENARYQSGIGGAVNVLSSIAGSIGSFYSGNVAGGLSGLGNTINAVQSAGMSRKEYYRLKNSPQLSITGTRGSLGMVVENRSPSLYFNYYSPTIKPIEDYGGVLNRSVYLNTLTGYTEIANGSLPIVGTMAEKQTLKQMLEGGFFLE